MVIFKSEFKTWIGQMYYLWRDSGVKKKIIFLGTGKGTCSRFTAGLASGPEGTGSIGIIEKKSFEIERGVTDYLEGRSKELGLEPEFISGSEFERSVWLAVFSIPFGETASYGQIARLSGHGRAHRAAGTALSKNPLMLVVPCHRIIKSDGNVGSFSGGMGIKEALLRFEGSEIIGQKVMQHSR